MLFGLMLKHKRPATQQHFQDWRNPGKNKFIPGIARNCPGVVTPLLEIVCIMDWCLVDLLVHHVPHFTVVRIIIWTFGDHDVGGMKSREWASLDQRIIGSAVAQCLAGLGDCSAPVDSSPDCSLLYKVLSIKTTLPITISAIRLLFEQRSFHLSSFHLAKNCFTNPASNTFFYLFGANTPWDERPGTKRPHQGLRSKGRSF